MRFILVVSSARPMTLWGELVHTHIHIYIHPQMSDCPLIDVKWIMSNNWSTGIPWSAVKYWWKGLEFFFFFFLRKKTIILLDFSYIYIRIYAIIIIWSCYYSVGVAKRSRGARQVVPVLMSILVYIKKRSLEDVYNFSVYWEGGG